MTGVGTSLRGTASRRSRAGVPVGRYLALMWIYRLADFDPSAGVAEEEWARRLAAEGWQMWLPGSGPWIDMNGRQVRRWSVRCEGGGSPQGVTT